MILLDAEGGGILNDAISVIQTVPQWNEAYPRDAIQKRIIDSMFDGGEADAAVQRLVDGLVVDCKAIRAYVAFSGFHLEPDVEIQIGKYSLRVLGTTGVESEIIERLNQHMEAAKYSEELRVTERERYRTYLLKHANLPVLVVEYHGSIDGAAKLVEPIAEHVALFMQFCIGALTERYYDNPIIVDYRGRFTGEFSAFMPVMTIEFDQLSLPNLRGFPYDCVIAKDDVTKLQNLGVLALANQFLELPSDTPNAIKNLLMRAMASFADGERAVSNLSRMTAYVTSAEVFFSQKDRVVASVTRGLAAANSTNESEYEQNLGLAENVYKQRSEAVHQGFEPTWGYIARKLALGAIFRMISMQGELTTRKKVRDWLEPRMPKTARCPTCGKRTTANDNQDGSGPPS